VYRTAADSGAAVVSAERKRITAANDPRVFPIESVGSGFVGDPVPFGIPEGASFQREDIETRAGQPLKKDPTRRTATDDR